MNEQHFIAHKIGQTSEYLIWNERQMYRNSVKHDNRIFTIEYYKTAVDFLIYQGYVVDSF